MWFPDFGLDCQNFRRVIVGEDATVKHPIGEGVLDEGDKSPTATPGRAIAPDIGIICELFERGVHAKFSLLDTDDQHLVALQEVLQLCITGSRHEESLVITLEFLL